MQVTFVTADAPPPTTDPSVGRVAAFSSYSVHGGTDLSRLLFLTNSRGLLMELRFRVPSDEEMERPPTQRDQFDNDDVDLVDALVRESIQNSLDAKAGNGKVKVRFSIESIDGDRLARANRFLHPEVLNKHLVASDLKSIDPTSPMNVLVVEDFGTTGLVGSWEKWDEKPFCDFWRRMGRSHKGGQALGRWGLGKLVFSSASRARVFLGLTSRHDDGAQLLMGQAVLTTHSLPDGTRQDSHGFYAAPGNGIQLPIRTGDQLDEFKRTFGLTRVDQPGLSIVVPYLRDSIKTDRIIKGVLRNYFFPILFGRLEFSIGDVLIDASTYAQLASEWDPEHFRDGTLAAFIQAMKESRESGQEPSLVLPQDWARKDSAAALGNNIEGLRTRLNDGEVLQIRAPLLLKRKDGNEFRTHIDVFLQKSPTDVPALFVRGAIVLNAEHRYFRGRKTMAAVIADEARVSEFLGDAENPAHTGWSATAEKVSSKWRSARDRLSDIRQLPQRLFNVLASAVETFDRDALADVFSMPAEPGTTSPEPGGENVEPRTIPEIPTTRKTFRVQHLPNGFSLRGSGIPQEDLPLTIRVKVAYDVLRGNPFKKHDAADFDLRRRDLSIDARGATTIAKSASTLQVDVDEADFEVHVCGFDSNRDLIVDSEKVA